MSLRSQLGLLVAFAALAAAGRLAFLALPNIALTFFVVAVAGLTYGPRLAAAAGALAMLVTGMALSGPGPGVLASALGAGMLGLLAGALRGTRLVMAPRRDLATVLLAAALGVGMQALFSVTSDVAGWAMFAGLPEGPSALPLLVPLLVAGLAFNIPGMLFQAALFGAALHPVVQALRAAGLAEVAPPPQPEDRVVIVAEAPTPASPRRTAR